MHIIIGVITAIATLVFALNRLQDSGVNLNSFNPFFWARRRAWANQQVNPLYAVETPRELGALLMLAVLRSTGDLTSDEKRALVALWQNELKFSAANANEMYGVCSHLLGTDPNYADRLEDIVRPASGQMSPAQRDSIVELLGRVAEVDPAARHARGAFADEIAIILARLAPH